MSEHKRTRRAWIAIGATLVGVAAVGTVATSGTASAAPPLVSGWVFPNGGSAASTATALTGVANSACPSGCGTAAPESSGGVQLTDLTNTFEDGGIVSGAPVDTTHGLDVQFNAYQYGGNGSADGITFFLADPSAGAVQLGAPGGHLGYGADPRGHDGTLPGLKGGVLGFGLDTFGNYGTNEYNGTGCASSDTAPVSSDKGTVDVRGAQGTGDGFTGYCLLATSFDQGHQALTLGGAPIPVRVVINTTGSTQTLSAGIGAGATLANNTYGVWITENLPNAVPTEVVSGTLTSGQVPASASLGFTASTGGSTDYHVVSGLSIAPLVAPATQLVFNPGPQTTPVSGSAADAAKATNQSGVKVSVESDGGAVDTDYNGSVTLTLNSPAPKPPAATVNGGFGYTPASDPKTLTVPVTSGVADFSTATFDSVGFGYTITASATPTLPAITSGTFDVTGGTASCGTVANPTPCSIVLNPTSTGTQATVTGGTTGGGSIEASFGGNSAPIYPCTSSAAGILTFNGPNGARMSVHAKLTGVSLLNSVKFCYGQPAAFKDVLLQTTTHTNSANGGEFEGLLPVCLPNFPKILPPANPCFTINSYNLKTGAEDVTIFGTANGDPKLNLK